MNKIFFLGLLVVAGVGLWFFSNQEEPVQGEEMTRVRITTMPAVQGLPLFLALEKGYFTEAGIDVEFVKFEAPNQIIDALLQGKVDFTPPSGATGVIGVANLKNPGKLQVYGLGGGDMTTQNDAMLVATGTSIQSVQDLRGKKVGIVAGSLQWSAISREVMRQNDLDPDKDVTLVELPLGLHAQALASGQVDALISVEPIPTVVKAKGIGRELVSNLSSVYVSDPFYAGTGVLRKEFATENPEATRKVLEVFARAVAEIQADPDAARVYLKDYTSLDDDMLALVPITRFTMYQDFTQHDKDAVQKFFDLMTEQGLVDERMDFESLVYTPPLSR